jgi:hypothetical protein
MVGLGRLELPTPRLSSVCSNQLSYRPARRSDPLNGLPTARTNEKIRNTLTVIFRMNPLKEKVGTASQVTLRQSSASVDFDLRRYRSERGLT